MKDNNGEGLGATANVVTLNEVTFVGANIGTITIIPRHTVNFTNGITGPVIITNNNGVVLNIQGAIAPSTITSFDDHFDINLDIHQLGAVAEEVETL